MNIAPVIFFLFQDFLIYMRKIDLHLHIQCVIRIALCISFSICNIQYAKKTETFHQCTTIQVKLISLRYSMDVKDKERVRKDVNYHGSISSFKVCFETHGEWCKQPMFDVREVRIKVVVSWFRSKRISVLL